MSSPSPRANVLAWDDRDIATAPDGAKYVLVSETIRGEGKWWWAEVWTKAGKSEINHPTDPWAKTKRQAKAAAEHHARQRQLRSASST